MPQNHVALISPIDGIAGLYNESEKAITLVAPSALSGRKIAAGNYATRYPHSTAVEVATGQEAVKRLNEQRERSLALDFTLLLFDVSTSPTTRQRAAAELNGLLKDSHCQDYVLDIVLSSPLPDEADPAGATLAAKNQSLVRALIATIRECQERVAKVFAAWLALRSDPMVDHVGIENVQGALIHFGVFRKLVEEGKSKADVEALKRIVLNQELSKCCDPRIVLKLIMEYSSLLPTGSSLALTSPQITNLEVGDESDDAACESELPAKRKNGDLKRGRAESQVAKIAHLFGQGNDQTATQFLEQLIESQTQNISDHPHLVKSLCNIANRCITPGRRDISFQCLIRALTFKNGIDAVLYLQIGCAFRDLDQFDRAIACYEEALKLDRGEKRDQIRLEIIRTSVAKGDYENALTAYLQIPDIDIQPQTLCSLGTLYRRMGNLTDARKSYLKALKVEDSCHAALAGLAEANKQTGRHFKAIKRYLGIFNGFGDELEESSWKVYSLALSFLYRVTHQLNKAESLLTTLNERYRRDADIHLQLAKLFLLKGDNSRAKEHFIQAQSPSLDSIANQLFRTAIDGLLPQLVPVGRQQNVVAVELPEERGLVSCNLAMLAMKQGDFYLAQEKLNHARYVDRLQADFGAVLRYHAKKKLVSTYDYKEDRTVCRIAKHGYKELRNSVRAIAEGRFDVADEMEHRMCLLVA